MFAIVKILLGLVLLTSTLAVPHTSSAERRLVNMLLARYAAEGKVARPVSNPLQPVDVQFGIRLVHLDLDEKEQVMKTSVWAKMIWIDELLKWEPKEFSDLTTVVIPADRIWTPAVALVNTAEIPEDEQPIAHLSVKYNGWVFWIPQRKYSSACLLDVTEYPYDKHTCEMWFQSISDRGSNLNITAYQPAPLDLDTYLSSYRDAQEWDILANETTWHERPRDVGMILMWSRRPSLRFSLTVQRRAGFTGILLIVPCALLSVLIPLIFCLHPDRPDRHTLAMSLFGSLTILLFMVTEVAPPSASFVPRLALYYCFNLLLLLLATCCSTIVVNLNKRAETREKVPKAVRVVFIKGIGKCLCFRRRLEHLSEVKRASKRRLLDSTGDACSLENGPSAENHEFASFRDTRTEYATNLNTTNPFLLFLSGKLDAIHAQLRQQTPSVRADPPDVSVPADMRVEWRTLAMVLDRLFFYVFLILDVVSFAIFLPKIPSN